MNKIERILSVVDRVFKAGILVLSVVAIIVYYTSANGRYHFLRDYLKDSGEGYVRVLDTRTGDIIQRTIHGGLILIETTNIKSNTVLREFQEYSIKVSDKVDRRFKSKIHPKDLLEPDPVSQPPKPK